MTSVVVLKAFSLLHSFLIILIIMLVLHTIQCVYALLDIEVRLEILILLDLSCK